MFSEVTVEPEDLTRHRERIDEIDRQVIALLNERARLAIAIGRMKAAHAAPTFVPEREQRVLANIIAAAGEGPLRPQHVRAIYREVLSACRGLEQPLRIGFLGPAATFSHQAAIERFGEGVELVPVPTITDVFIETARGGCDFGVVPVENSTEGPVNETLDNLVERDLKVCSEITLPIVQNLLANVPLASIARVYSIPQASGQCRRWLMQHLPGRDIVPVVSTARAAEQAASDPEGAAIAPRLAAEVYGLQIVATNIQDLASNYTRFLVISPQASTRPSGRDKTALVFSIRDRIGALRDVVNVIAERGINMSSIQSRPSRRRAWDYVFYVELEGHQADPRVADALEALKPYCLFLKPLGSWPTDNVLEA